MADAPRRPTGTIKADPNPVRPPYGKNYGQTTLAWETSGVDAVEIHVGAPDGPLLARGGQSGAASTGEWVSDWTTFFLQDLSDRRPLTIANTLSSVCVRVAKPIAFGNQDEAGRHERRRLEQLPRYKPATTTLQGRPFEIIDASSFLTMHDEIVEQGIYGFQTTRERPFIIDCGANVGVSVCYFKALYPTARILAFEPDNRAFAALSRNAVSLGWDDVTLVNKAVAHRESDAPFVGEQSWAGRLARPDDVSTTSVPAVRLQPYIDEQVDLLKLDIEGAETDVLLDCASILDRIDRIVVEYHSFANEPQTLDRLLTLLSRARYRAYVRSVSAEWPLQPFLDCPVYFGMDLQLYIYAFRTPTTA